MAAVINIEMQVHNVLRKICAYKLVSPCNCYQARNISMSVVSEQRRNEQSNVKEDGSEFRTYQIPGLKSVERKRFTRRFKRETPPPRYRRMLPDQDWTNVWPAAVSFKWSVVPLPVRQGWAEKTTENKGIVPDKYGNAELMKLPNFLHLTPAHIKKHCQAIKKFCTKWPKGLEKNKAIEQHFPVTVTTADFCFASPSVQDARARTVTLQLKLANLKLDYHARDKLLRLVGGRYNPKTDTLTIITNRCPARHQNYDYAMYLLTAIYYESWKTEAWEEDKTEADMEFYRWDNSPSSNAVLKLLTRYQDLQNTGDDASTKNLPYLPPDVSENALLDLDPVKAYKEAVLEINNEGENLDSLTRYKESVKKLLNLQTS